jgi:hypothetical protein
VDVDNLGIMAMIAVDVDNLGIMAMVAAAAVVEVPLVIMPLAEEADKTEPIFVYLQLRKPHSTEEAHRGAGIQEARVLLHEAASAKTGTNGRVRPCSSAQTAPLWIICT